MKSFLSYRASLTAFAFLCWSSATYSQATNQTCATATTGIALCSGTPTNGDLYKATSASTDGGPAGGSGSATTSTFDVWYKFTATATTHVLTLSVPTNKSLTPAATFIEVFSGACGSSMTSLGWASATTSTLRLTNLAIGTTYYTRVYSTVAVTANPANGYAFTICLNDPPANDNCSGAITLTSNATCTTTTTTMDLATASTGLPVGCESAGLHYDVWYTFTPASSTETVTISGLTGTNISNPEIQLYSGTCGALTSVTCGTTTLTATGLSTTASYYVRVSNVGTDPSATNNSNFSICVTHPTPPPANDNCVTATTLTSAATCTNTAGTLAGATISASSVPASSCAGTPGGDVWYSFVAQTSYPTISLSSIGSSFSGAGVMMQLVSGSCGNFTSLTCVSGSTASLSLNTAVNPGGTGLTVGTTYYIRVYSPTASPAGTGWTYNICITDPALAKFVYSKSYINVSKGTVGGVVEPGDTLEMRATFVVSSKTVDSLSFTDTLFNANGLKLLPGSIALRTNEGKIYGNSGNAFTDAFDTDAGWFSTAGSDTVIHINFGTGSSNFKRGQLSNTSKPSVFLNTCIIMATYRVVVYAGFNTKINFKTGSLTYKDPVAPVVSTLTFNKNNLIVYQSPGLCPNAVSASNAVGVETNGTFGKLAIGTPAPLARNRSASSNTNYIYNIFSTAGGPQDFQYGIANNTSGVYTTINTYVKPDATNHRVFSQWDIIGDHTGASNTARGNPACDTTLPVSATNPCGYMLVINSAYKTDTAFQYTASNLCPNTYYEISAWFRNICYKCGCDSNGKGGADPAFIPLAIGDSSGVQPNIAFDVNGTDYYTTGNIPYYGTTLQTPGATPTGSDTLNKWVKRGFTYLTGPSETSFTLTLRNNAPGGGGNDWAMDDISIATCLPNMQYSPTISPTTCQSNTVTVNDTVSSYFNNYNYYKWQLSTDNGTTWTDISGQSGSATPTTISSGYQYVTSYTIPPTSTTTANNGNKYRVTVATTSSNLSNSNCQFTDGISIITLTVLNNCSVLPVKILSFNGNLVQDRAHLFWTVSREQEPVQYSIERSVDGISFSRIGLLHSRNLNAEQTQYSFADTAQLKGRAWYRIALIDQKNHTLYSRSILLSGTPESFMVATVVNPFRNDLPFDVSMNQEGKLTATLYTLSGMQLKQQSYTVYNGMNGLNMTDLKSLAQGMYLLQVQYGSQTIIRKVVKQ